MLEKPDNQITLFIRDEKNWSICFQVKSVEGSRALIQQKRVNGETHSKNLKNPNQIWLRKKSQPRAATPQNSFSLGVPYTRC
jgi:hypothetical protein